MTTATDRQHTPTGRHDLGAVMTAIEAMFDGVVITDLDLRTVQANKAALERFGRTLQEVLGRPSYEFILQEQVPRALETLSAVLREGAVKNAEFTGVAKNGETFPISVNLVLLRDPQGQPECLLLAFKDMTAISQAQDEKIAALQEVAAIAEAMNDGLIVTDLDGNIVSCNTAIQEQFKEYGVNVKQLIGQPAAEWPGMRTEDTETYLQLMKQTMEEGKAGPLEMRDKAGRWFSFTTSLLRDVKGNPKGMFAVVRNISSLKAAHEEKYAAMQEGLTIAQAMSEGLIITDLDGNVVSFNRAMKEHLEESGKSPEESIGKPAMELSTIKPEDIPTYLELMNETVEKGKAGPVEFINKQGRWSSITTGLLHDTAGSPRAIFAISTDVSKLKAADAERAEAMAAKERAAIIDAMGDGLVLSDMDGLIASVNPALERLTGYNKDEMVGQYLAELAAQWIRPDDVEKALESLKSILGGQAVGGITFTLTRKDGSEVPITFTSTFRTDAAGNPIATVATVKDITEITRAVGRAEAALQDKAAIIEAMGDGLAMFDMEGNITGVNPALEQLTGYSSDDMVGKNFFDLAVRLLRPQDVENTINNIKRILNDHTVAAAPLTVIRKDGSEVCVSLTTSFRRDPAGNPITGIVAVKDMTDLRRAQEKEKALATAVARTQMAATVMDAMGDAVLLAAIDGTIIAVNPAFEKLTGNKKEDLVDKSVPEMIPMWVKGRDLDTSMAAFKAAIVGQLPAPMRLAHVAADGRQTPIILSISLIRNTEGQPTHMIATIRDITELERLQKAEKDAETSRAVGDVVNAMADGVVLIDMEGKIISVNPAYERVTGKRASEVIGSDVSEMIPVVLKPEDVETAMNALGVAFREGISRPVIATFLREDGSEVPMAFTASLVNDPKGSPQHLVVVAKDMTDLRRAQEKEKALAATVARTQMAGMVMDAMGDGVLLVAIDGTVIAVNPALEQMTGYTKDEFVGSDMGELLPVLFTGNDLERAMATLAATMAGKGFGPTRFAYVRKDGRQAPALVTMSFISDAEGKPTHMVAAIKDITELERLEQKEKEATALSTMADVIGAMGDGLVTFDMDGKITFVNPAVEKLSGYSANELVGHEATELIMQAVSAEEVEASAEALKSVLAGDGEAAQSLTVIAKDGHKVPIVMTTTLRKDTAGNPLSFVLTIKDMTELARAQEREKELAATVERTRMAATVVDAVSDSVLLASIDGTVIAINPAFEISSGYARDEIVGKDLAEIMTTFLKPTELERGATMLAAALAGKGFGPTRFTYLRKDGTEGPVLVSLSFIRDAEGRPTHLIATVRDISELERLQEKEKEAAALTTMANIIDAMADGVVLVDMDGKVVSINPAHEKLTGNTRSDVIGRNVSELISGRLKPEDIERATDALGRALREGVPRPVVVTFLREDGSEVPVAYTASLVKDAEGKPTHLVAVAKDITELKQAQKKERELTAAVARTQMAATVIDAVDDGVLLCSVDGTMIAANPAFETLTGYAKDELVGKNASEMLSTWSRGQDLDTSIAMFEAVTAGRETVPKRFTHIARDGREIPIFAGVSLVRNAEGEPTHVITTVKDITELERLQQKEKEAVALQYVANALDCMPDPVWLLDLDGTVTYANPASAQWSNAAAGDAVGQDALTLALKGVAPEDMETLMPRMFNMKAGTISETPLLLHILTDDGRRIPTLMTSGFIRDAQGAPKGIITIAKDVSELKRAEDELRKSRELLEQRVTERTADLVKANKQIRQAQADLVQVEKMSMLGQLVAGVAHEINTPTGAIMNVAADSIAHLHAFAATAMNVLDLPVGTRRWLAKTIPYVLSQETVVSEIAGRDARRQIEHELRRQGIADYRRMADVMLACRMDASDPLAMRCMADERVLVFLEHLIALKASSEICHASVRKIATIVKALRYYSRSGEGEMFDINVNESIDNTLVILHNRIKHVAKIERRFQESLPALRLGPDISQVWSNILSNACDAIEAPGGGKTGLIRIATTAEGDSLIVEVFNEGPPIPQDLMARIFDPFFTTKPIGKGTGLGLSICTGILGKYNGRIEARNDPKGVTFRVSLPLALGHAGNNTRLAGGRAE